MKMGSLDGQFFRKRMWEADFPMQSPQGKMRTLVVEAGVLGMEIRLCDVWEEGSRKISQEVFRDRFWTTPESSIPCLAEDRRRVLDLLKSLDGPLSGDGTAEVAELFQLAFVRSQAVRHEGGWLKEYLPDLYADAEAAELRDREQTVRYVLTE